MLFHCRLLLAALFFAACAAPHADAQTISSAPRATVTVFLATDCPLARRAVPRIKQISRVFAAQNVRFVGAFPNAADDEKACQAFAANYHFPFAFVRGEAAQALARKYNAEVSPEIVITDAAGAVRYKGDIDDRDTGELSRVVPDTANALRDILANRPVKVSRTRARGCALLLPDIEKATTFVTYARDIAPILNQNCVECHRSGAIGPMPLDTYERAVRWSKEIVRVTSEYAMPPWKAESHGEFHDERRLTDGQIGLLASWANGGTPSGDLKTLAPLPAFPTGWTLGKPDVVFALPEAFSVPAAGKDFYRCFIIPANLDADKWVSGVEYRPGNAGVVHHVSVFVDTSGAARRLAKAQGADTGPLISYLNPTPGNGPGFAPYAGSLGGWTPGHAPRKLPAGVALRLPKNADIVMEIHYHLSGKPEKDKSQMGVYWAKEPVQKHLRVADISSATFSIPPGDANYLVEASGFVPEDITVLSVTPHLHNLGKSMRVSATLPDGTFRLLVDVNRWDFAWQPSYRFVEPVKLPRGTRIDVSARFDNTTRKPKQSAPPADCGQMGRKHRRRNVYRVFGLHRRRRKPNQTPCAAVAAH